MSASQQWISKFKITPDDIDMIVNVLLERETPMSTRDLALMVIGNRLEGEADALAKRFEDVRVYNPADAYEVGERLVFPTMDFKTASVVETRAGFNPEYGEFDVMTLEFEDNGGTPREFAMNYQPEHTLNENSADMLLPGGEDLNPDDLLAADEDAVLGQLEEKLVTAGSLAYVGKRWFPRDLMIELDEGHLNLAEAVLDMIGGGPATTDVIIEQIGGLGSAPMLLQSFSMNHALNEDERFDEVGPAGEVLWYLKRMQPEELHRTPAPLVYMPISYDRDSLPPDMQALEHEIGDELSELDIPGPVSEATVTLIYPHRRVGTLPLNARTRHVFPTAERAPRIWVTLVDKSDGEEYNGWVVHREQYVYGLGPIYRKHKMPIGSFITVRQGDEPDKIEIDVNDYRPRSEYIPLFLVKGDQKQIAFENEKRPIGVDYDDLTIIGIEELKAVENIATDIERQRRSLAWILKAIIPALGGLTPQNTAHAKTIYSAVNVLRRCPPGPILAMLLANPDFENVGGHYWKLSDS